LAKSNVTIQKDQFETTSEGLLVRAPAKINLSLLVDGLRPDGYHEISTVMAKVNWYDELLIERSEKAGIELICTGRYWSPDGGENLVYKACELLCEYAGINPALKVALTKNVPAGAGLGSGSSDAAAALVGLNRLLGPAVDEKQLSELAAQLGSDVPFFLGGPLALCTGRGEKIEKIKGIFGFWAVIVLSDINVCTKSVYENFRHKPDVYKALEARINEYIKKNRIDLVAHLCANILFENCLELHKELAKLKERIESLCAGPVCLTGSGSALYVLFDEAEEQKAKLWQKTLKQSIGCESVIVNNNRW
jgi:4-diphosphocytidyl-2-C-methyl-D-erythritol kinase